MFCLQWNDKLFNNYNAAIILRWMANLNTSPATSVAVIVNYVGKYCSKEEKKSTFYKKKFKTVTLYISKLHAFNFIVAKFMNKLIGK